MCLYMVIVSLLTCTHVTPPFGQNLRMSLPLLFGLVGHIILTIYHLHLLMKPPQNVYSNRNKTPSSAPIL